MFNFRIAPEGVDLVLDCMAGDDCERGLALLKFNGKYIMYGTSSLLSWDVKNFFGFTKGMTNVSYMIDFIDKKIYFSLLVVAK
jgi:NADPH:quinone reductase-like Zn-dependent oxidoreductase